MIDLKKLSDVQSVVDSLSGLPKEALFYIAGYAEGFAAADAGWPVG